MLTLENLKNIKIPESKILDLLKIYEIKGASFYYTSLFKKEQKSFFKKRFDENLFYFAKFININLTDERIKLLIKKDFVPKNNEEQYFLNLKIAFNEIEKNLDIFSILSNSLIDLSNLLTNKIKHNKLNLLDKTKLDIYPFFYLENEEKKYSPRLFLQEYVDFFLKEYNANKNEIISILLAFFLDLICLNFFEYENESLAYILFYGYLLKHFEMFRYIPFFKYLFEKKEYFEKVLLICKTNFDLKAPEIVSLFEVIVDIMISVSHELKKKGHSYEFEITRIKDHKIENYIMKTGQIFTRDEIRSNLRVSESTINRTLKRMKEEGKIMPLGTGRSCKWQRIVSSEESILGKNIFSKVGFLDEE